MSDDSILSGPGYKIQPMTIEQMRLDAFDVLNNVEPFRTIAERIVAKYGFSKMHAIVDDIAHAIEDAEALGEKRGPLVKAAFPSADLQP